MTQTVLLGDVCKKIDYGFTASADFSVASPKFLRITDIQGGYIDWRTVPGCEIDPTSIKKNRLHKGDIVIARTGNSTGENAYIKDDINAVFASFLIRFQPDERKVYPPFLRYILRSNRWFDFSKSLAHAKSAQPGANAKELSSFRFILPDMESQVFYGDALSEIDEKIELNRKMNETLEQMGQALFRHYFINNPEAEKWEEGKFADVADVLTGKGSTKSQLSEGGTIPLYGANGVMGTSEDYLYDEPLVITGRVGTLGKVRAVTGKAWFSDNVLIMRPKVASFGFIYHLAQTFDYISMNRGSTQPLVTQTDLKNRKIRIPDTQTLEEFEQQFSHLFERQQNNDEQIQTLTTLRDTLLPRLINGKLKI